MAALVLGYFGFILAPWKKVGDVSSTFICIKPQTRISKGTRQAPCCIQWAHTFTLKFSLSPLSYYMSSIPTYWFVTCFLPPFIGTSLKHPIKNEVEDKLGDLSHWETFQRVHTFVLFFSFLLWICSQRNLFCTYLLCLYS